MDNTNTNKKPFKKLVSRDDPAVIFIGNLPNSITKKKLRKLLSTFGTIRALWIRSSMYGKQKLDISSKGEKSIEIVNAYIAFSNKSEAISALKLNGLVVNNQHIRVDLAASDDAHKNSESTIFVGNLSFTIDEETVRTFFADCGHIINIRIVRDKYTGFGKGFCYVTFKDKDSVDKALLKKDNELHGRLPRIFKYSAKSHNNKVIPCTSPQASHLRLKHKRKYFHPKKYRKSKNSSKITNTHRIKRL